MAICAKFLGHTSSMHPLAIASPTTTIVEPEREPEPESEPVPDKPSWKTPLNPIDFCIFHYYSTWGI